MPAKHRKDQVGREQRRATVRALHVAELEAAGNSRAEALSEADQQLDRIAQILPHALNAGLTVTDVGRVTGVSRPTLYQLRGRYSDAPGHLRVAVLQAVASLGVAPLDALVSALGRPSEDFWPILSEFVDTQVMEVAPTEEEDPQPAFSLSANGHLLVEHWETPHDADESGAM
jgi:hypothetical protein